MAVTIVIIPGDDGNFILMDLSGEDPRVLEVSFSYEYLLTRKDIYLVAGHSNDKK